MQKLEKKWLGIDSVILDRLVSVFNDEGFGLYLVGGCVRDMLLGKKCHDIDMATSATPSEIKGLFALADADSIFTLGEKYGTIGALFGETVIEITTFRGEWYIPGDRHPVVEFSTDLRKDLGRRDFTINAMAYDLVADGLIDIFGGESDLHNRILQAVGNPTDRFFEDPLRMMRALRFRSQLEMTLEQETENAIDKNVFLLETVSWERKRDELCKLLQGSWAKEALETMRQLGVLTLLLPEVDALLGIDQRPFHEKDAFEHTLLVVKKSERENMYVRLAALFHDVGKATTRSEEQGKSHFYGHEDVGREMTEIILRRFCFDGETIRKVCTLVGLHMEINRYHSGQSDKMVRKLVRKAGDVLEGLIQLSYADRESDIVPEYYEKIAGNLEHFCERVKSLEAEEKTSDLKSPLDGREIMELLGRKQGPWLRAFKEALLEKVYAGELKSGDKVGAKQIVEDLVSKGW